MGIRQQHIVVCLALVSLAFISACVPPVKPNTPDADVSQLPCWLEQPVSDSRVGQIGIARSISADGSKNPEVRSRLTAVENLVPYLGYPDTTGLEISADQDSVSLAGQQIEFAKDYSQDGYVYSYAQLSGKSASNESCPMRSCDLSNCEPKWLCNPHGEKEAGLLGISYRTSSPESQYRKAVDNALLQAEYILGIKVDATQRLKTVANSREHLSILRTQSNVSSGSNQHRYLITDSCRNHGTLYLRMSMPDFTAQNFSSKEQSEQWMKNPKYKGYDGAVGSVERPMASGFFSDQLDLAIKRAAVQLAFEKNTHLKEDLLNVQHSDGGTFYISTIDQSTNVAMKVRVLGLHFKPTDTDKVKVYTWIARVQE